MKSNKANMRSVCRTSSSSSSFCITIRSICYCILSDYLYGLCMPFSFDYYGFFISFFSLLFIVSLYLGGFFFHHGMYGADIYLRFEDERLIWSNGKGIQKVAIISCCLLIFRKFDELVRIYLDFWHNDSPSTT